MSLGNDSLLSLNSSSRSRIQSFKVEVGDTEIGEGQLWLSLNSIQMFIQLRYFYFY